MYEFCVIYRWYFIEMHINFPWLSKPRAGEHIQNTTPFKIPVREKNTLKGI